MRKSSEINSLMDVVRVFSSEKVCREHLKKMRWKNGIFCPHCGCVEIYAFSDEKHYKCSLCRKKFTVTVGTIFEGTKIKLQKWFIAIYLLTSHKKGISSLQLSKDIGVTQKTAWFMLHRLRQASQTTDFNAPLKNVVEIDETYIGGKERNKHVKKRVAGTQGRSHKTKAPVLGMVERHGNLKAIQIQDSTGQTIRNQVVSNVVMGSQIMTDEYGVYRSLSLAYFHKFICHKNGQYFNNGIHTNTIEGFFSLLKRGIIGIYHYVSQKHLNRYLREFSFRYNTRDVEQEQRFNWLLNHCNGRLTYKNLIGC